MQLSVLIASIRPARVHNAIARLRPDLAPYDYEIVVVSPFEISGPRIVWVPEETPRGGVHATNLGFAAVKGDLLLQAADDIAFDRGCISPAIVQMGTMRACNLPCVGFAHQRGKQAYVNVTYGRYVPGFYLAPTAALRYLGETIYDPVFKVSWADQDLGLRIWDVGGRCEIATGGVVHDFGTSEKPTLSVGMNETNTSREFEIFAAKWSAKQPEFWGRDIRSIAHPLSAALVPLVDPDGLTIDVRTPEAALDLRIAAALTTYGDGAATPIPMDIARQARAYLRWTAALEDDPINVLVAARNQAFVTKVSHLFGSPAH